MARWWIERAVGAEEVQGERERSSQTGLSRALLVGSPPTGSGDGVGGDAEVGTAIGAALGRGFRALGEPDATGPAPKAIHQPIGNGLRSQFTGYL